MPRPPRQHAHRVPRHFFCPISGRFMREPVIVASLEVTSDHGSVLTLIGNTSNTEANEVLTPDHDLRSQMSAWLHRYERRPTFAYISTPQHLDSAVTSLLTQYTNDILEDSDLLDNLRQSKSVLHGKIALINSAQGSSLLIRLVEGCPVSPDNAGEWVKLSVGILASAKNIQNENPSLFVDYWRPVLEVIDRVCVDIGDADFEEGLVNLLYLFMRLKLEDVHHIITCHGGVIEALSSYILRPNSNGPFADSKSSFQKLFTVIMKLWLRKEGLKQPKLSQAVAALVWPMHEQISNAQYHSVLRSISSVLRLRRDGPDDNDLHNDNESSLELMTRAGLVSRVFQLLNYITLSGNQRLLDPLGWVERGRTVSEAEEGDMIMRCFEILCFLSSVTIGRLEMVRVIKRSAFGFLRAFYGAIVRVVSADTAESHVMPALSVLCNLVEKTRYTEVMEKAEGQNYDAFTMIDFENLGLGTISRKFFQTVDRIEAEEDFYEDDIY